jgi:glycerol-3-phosphate dehydrogenase (NAD(P)+)
MRAVLAALPPRRPLVLCAKGMEEATTKLMHEVAREEQPDAPIAVLSGPTFAHEVAAGLPTAVTLAVEDAAAARRSRGGSPALLPALSVGRRGRRGDRRRGQERARHRLRRGRGAGLGLNARAALISRGFAEMTRFGLARGARAETLAGLSGLGDLVLTCSSTNSRNFSLGKGSARGAAPPSCWPTAAPSPKAPTPPRCCAAPRRRRASTCRSSRGLRAARRQPVGSRSRGVPARPAAAQRRA